MRFFKVSQAVQSEEDRARDARLTAIAGRYRVRELSNEVDAAARDPLEIGNLHQ